MSSCIENRTKGYECSGTHNHRKEVLQNSQETNLEVHEVQY